MKNPSRNPEKNDSEGIKKSLNSYTRYSNMAFQMFVIIGAGAFGGIKLDQWVQLRFPLFTLILTLAAVFLAIYISIKDLLKK